MLVGGGPPPLRIDYVWFLRMEGGGLNKCNMQAGGTCYICLPPPFTLYDSYMEGGGSKKNYCILHVWGPPGFWQAKGVGMSKYFLTTESGIAYCAAPLTAARSAASLPSF